MINNVCVFEEIVFFDLWIPDSGFRFPGFMVPLGNPVSKSCSTSRKVVRGRFSHVFRHGLICCV